MNESKSVYHLIGKLCTNLIKESEENVEGFGLSKAFEILLRSNDCDCDREKLVEELQFASFELLLANRCDDSEQISQVIDKLKDTSQDFEQICWLLVHLKNIDPDQDPRKQVN